ncbi:hypothetical protein DFR70_102746 [Nocardia tenerifensis]|uniref:Uncharacterized protein n=1 Tax=Nocardia tenerifensis TaxID=228006 RepID=A0A318KDA1_9NOCA|nr:hypothetical protein [Nocardia tenerifensis]PXX69060.1 hypothetical protein DFR70_102746 [Nocardia tenerifensis]
MSEKPIRVPLPICGPECLCCSVIPERAIDAAAHAGTAHRRGLGGRRRRMGPLPPACDVDEAQT